MAKTDKPTEKVIETSAIRLSADETRAVMSAATMGKPSSGYYCHSLVGLGLMRRVKVTSDDEAKAKYADCWERLRKAVAQKNRDAADKAISAMSTLDRSAKAEHYVLTDLGKQVARGISVKLNGQYGPKR